LFKADSENQLFREVKLAHNIRKLRESGLIDFLIDKYNHPEAIILFGSFRKAENIPGSDVDLLIVTPLKKEIDFKDFEKKLNQQKHILNNSRTEIERMKTKNKELLNNLINGIVLEGFWEVFL
jgi:predicted nucleotidyltransferase